MRLRRPPGCRPRLNLLAGLAAIAVLRTGCAPTRPVSAGDDARGQPSAVAVYALSRGKGVPEPTRDAFRKARALLKDLERDGKARLEETRIGLEGETRLCAEFKDPGAARETLDKLRALSREVELMNVVEEPCRTAQ
jgi:hypothetical protein